MITYSDALEVLHYRSSSCHDRWENSTETPLDWNTVVSGIRSSGHASNKAPRQLMNHVFEGPRYGRIAARSTRVRPAILGSYRPFADDVTLRCTWRLPPYWCTTTASVALWMCRYVLYLAAVTRLNERKICPFSCQQSWLIKWQSRGLGWLHGFTCVAVWVGLSARAAPSLT